MQVTSVHLKSIKSNVLLVSQQGLHSLTGISKGHHHSLNFLFDLVELFGFEVSWQAGEGRMPLEFIGRNQTANCDLLPANHQIKLDLDAADRLPAQ